ncbi:hypothetical protein HT746_22110 [Burkholderia pyrrocinia]|uniref:hypothetical protein n=1 Tax=Burkholderia pyrrocinia TaxID=60550 RepID=UPI0015751166|nr:hypothetical protein [Burkholderia pyrrocinia]NTX29784.1 hypothetical protein [Burkholderia pyrrocinia]QVN23343.1 hypothetical protein JYG32_33150 [Burkholderia pyrrocinia]
MKILAASPHEVERIGVQSVLHALLVDGVIVLHAASGVEMVEQIDRHSDIQLVIVDVNIPDGVHVKRLAELAMSASSLPVIALDGGDGNLWLYASKINLAHAIEKASPLAVFADAVLGVLPNRMHRHPRKCG